jgi:anthranilate synthase component 1
MELTLASRYRGTPRVRRIAATSPFALFSAAYDKYDVAFLLESAGGGPLARYSFIGFDPAATVRVREGILEAEGASGRARRGAADPLQELRALLGARPGKAPFPYFGGAVGYLSYDLVRYWERLPGTGRGDVGFPDLEFGIFEDGVVFDHRRREAYYFTVGRDRGEELEGLLASSGGRGRLRAELVGCRPAREEFERLVLRAKRHILKGDIFQVVLSKRYELEFEGDLLAFYRALAAVNPSPYMYALKFGGRRIMGSSPEMLLRVSGRRLETFPIAGTRPRTGNEEEDERLREELMGDEKERAEHLMLVDLARNDCGKVARYGSVRVHRMFSVRRYSHVQHITTRVSAELREGLDAFDAVRALFPAGTVTGAPKLRAMEIIDRLEGMRRGPYAGAVGYFSFSGDADFAIAIRTLFAEGEKGFVQAGAGIVMDSQPRREWEETEAKLAALFRALEGARGE